MFLQQLWKLKISWDDPLPDEYQSRWTIYRDQLTAINEIRIPRYINNLNAKNIKRTELHSFADSSEGAYGACCYFRSIDECDNIEMKLICAKSRVTPTKFTTLPRLELCAALLYTELMQRIVPIIKTDETYYWSDSSIVLSWLSSPSYTWQTFVANRVAKILDVTNKNQWHHIESKQNPADLISRGVQPEQLINSKLWFHGPTFLQQPNDTWNTTTIQILNEDLPERRKEKSILLVSEESDFLDTIRHSNKFIKLRNIIAYCWRFFHNANKINQRNSGPLTIEEINNSTSKIIGYVQRKKFPSEIKSLKKNIPVDNKSRLRSLNPFLDKNGLIRVGGRMQNARIPYQSKHAKILPKNNNFSNILLLYFHEKHFHAAPQTLLSITRQEFWPLDGRTLARRIVQRCMRCFKCKPKTISTIMGNLPPDRVNPSRPFTTTGVDFCGPVKIHYNIRGKPPTKAYIAIFVCFATKATHLELVGDLSAAAFIASLKRFIARRGLCKIIYCDNATNFTGAKSELSDLKSMF